MSLLKTSFSWKEFWINNLFLLFRPRNIFFGRRLNKENKFYDLKGFGCAVVYDESVAVNSIAL